RPELAVGPANALRDAAHLPGPLGQDGDDLVRLTKLGGAQNDPLFLVERHAPRSYPRVGGGRRPPRTVRPISTGPVESGTRWPRTSPVERRRGGRYERPMCDRPPA